MHLVGKCVLYSYHFLDPLIQWIAIGNGWNIRQPIWPKPNMWNHCKVEQAKHAKQAGVEAGIWSQWRCHPRIQPIETFVEFENATNFKCFESQHNTVLDMDNLLLSSDVQMEVGQMYDELRRLFETFQQNVNKLTLNVNIKNSCIRSKWLCMACSNNKLWTLIFVKKIAHLTRMLYYTDAYLSRRLVYLDFYLPAWEKFSPPHTSSNLAQNLPSVRLWVPLL